MHDSKNSQYLLDGAVALLATGEDEIKSRLLRAYSQKMAYIAEPSIPNDLVPLLRLVRSKLTGSPTYSGQSTTEAALYRMHRKTASKIAASILELQRGMHRDGVV